MGGKVGDLAVQAVAEPPIGLEFGGPVALQATADQQLVKTIEPAEPVGLLQPDIGRMNGPAGGRFPAEVQIAQADPPDSHAAGWHDDEAEIAVPDFDHVNALGEPGPQRAFDDAIAFGRAADLFRP